MENDLILRFATVALSTTGAARAPVMSTLYRLLHMAAPAVGEMVAKMAVEHGGKTLAFSVTEKILIQQITRTALLTTAQQTIRKTSARPALNAFIQALARNFGASPKGPGPVMIVISLGLVLMSAQEAHAETTKVTGKLAEYENYLKRYGMWAAKRVEQNDPIPEFMRPQTFEEYLENPHQTAHW